jgi:anaerobic ribonucleoside-triphosphate reductase activating protein
MHIAQINSSTGLYEGTSLEIFISGCTHGCDGCQNPALWDFNYGTVMSVKEIMAFLKRKIGSAPPNWYDNIVLTGGDPLCSSHLYELIREIRWKLPGLKLWMYTGFSKEEIDQDADLLKCFNACDIVVTDRYDKTLPSIKFAGSSNQRIWRNQRVDMRL